MPSLTELCATASRSLQNVSPGVHFLPSGLLQFTAIRSDLLCMRHIAAHCGENDATCRTALLGTQERTQRGTKAFMRQVFNRVNI